MKTNKLISIAKVILALPMILMLCSCSSNKLPGTASGGLALEFIYSDGSSLYMNPKELTENDIVTVKIRTKKDNASEVYLHYDTDAANFKSIIMRKGKPVGEFDYYFAQIPPSKDIVYYYYEIKQYANRAYYSRIGVEDNARRVHSSSK